MEVRKRQMRQWQCSPRGWSPGKLESRVAVARCDCGHCEPVLPETACCLRIAMSRVWFCREKA